VKRPPDRASRNGCDYMIAVTGSLNTLRKTGSFSLVFPARGEYTEGAGVKRDW